MTISILIEEIVKEFDKQMADGTLFRTKLNYNSMAVQYANTPDIQNFIHGALYKIAEETVKAVMPEESQKFSDEHPEIWLDCCGSGEQNGWNLARTEMLKRKEEWMK